MRVTKASVRRSCSVCERTLLQGEVTVRFSPDGVEFVDVCPLCQGVALDYGWVREGGPMSRALSSHPRRRRPRWAQLLGVGNGEPAPVVPEPVLRRLTDSEAALVEAADLFNASLFRRTIEGVAKALGAPLVSIVPLSGPNSEVVLTFAWEITWYQYRVMPESSTPIRLADRGADVAEIEAVFAEWNAGLDDRRRVVPDVAR
jgi:Zn-finger nucleic acid-binding protein